MHQWRKHDEHIRDNPRPAISRRYWLGSRRYVDKCRIRSRKHVAARVAGGSVGKINRSRSDGGQGCYDQSRDDGAGRRGRGSGRRCWQYLQTRHQARERPYRWRNLARQHPPGDFMEFVFLARNPEDKAEISDDRPTRKSSLRSRLRVPSRYAKYLFNASLTW